MTKALEQLTLLLGERIEGRFTVKWRTDFATLLLTNKSIINKSLGHFKFTRHFRLYGNPCASKRNRPSPEPNLVLKFGDKLMVAGEKESVNELAQFIGNDEKRLSDTDFSPDRYGYRIGRIVWKIKYILLGFFLILSGTDRRYPYGCLDIKRHRKNRPDHLVYVRLR